MTKKIILGLGLSALIALSACNTFHGAGKDLESAGDAVAGASGKEGGK